MSGEGVRTNNTVSLKTGIINAMDRSSGRKDNQGVGDFDQGNAGKSFLIR